MAAVVEYPGSAQERWDEDSDLSECDAECDVAEPDVAEPDVADPDVAEEPDAEELDDAGELDSDEELGDDEARRYYDEPDGDEEEPEPVEPVDQNAVEPPAPTPQNPTRKATWADLAADEKDEIRRRVFDFGAMYEASAEPDPDRVGVPDPVVIRKDHWRLDENALALCNVTKSNDKWCRRLIDVVCERERAYWQAQQPAVDFNHVIAAIQKRDGVIVDEVIGEVRPVSSHPCDWGAIELPLGSAVEHIVRARWWYPRYANPNRRAFGNSSDLALAVRIVAMAQLLTVWQDQYKTWPQMMQLGEWSKFNAIGQALGWGDLPLSTTFRPAAMYFTRVVPFEGAPFDPTPIGQTVHDPLDTSHIAPKRYLKVAKRIIYYYGRPDLWNTAGLRTFEEAFVGREVVWGYRPLAIDAKNYIDAVLPKLLHNGDVDASFVSPNWPMGLYDTTAVRDMELAFENNKLFRHYIGDWNMQNVHTLDKMFRSSDFDGPIHVWKMPLLTSTEGMFASAKSFNHPIDNWAKHIMRTAVVEDVERYLGFNAEHMFQGATAFEQPVRKFLRNILGRPGYPATTTRMFEGADLFLVRAKRNPKKYLGKGVDYIVDPMSFTGFRKLVLKPANDADDNDVEVLKDIDDDEDIIDDDDENDCCKKEYV